MRKKIAILSAQLDEATQTRFITAFMEKAYAADYDMCIFSMHQKYQETYLRNLGDSNIFELINYSKFDAIVLLLDTIQTPNYKEILQRNIKEEFDGPVLVVDQISDYFEYIMMDHYDPVKKLVDHLIEVHGYKDIAFLGGREGHPHSVQRYNAFLDSMKAHELPIKDEWVFHGTYWYDSGKIFAKKLLEDRDNMPRALMCANDCMALAAAAEFSENGLKIPEDIAVVGYDSIQDGKDSPEPLTSADIPAGKCGEYCFYKIDSMLNGTEMPVFETNAPLFIGSSCGCEHKHEMVEKKQRPVWRTSHTSASVFSEFNHIMEDLLDASNIEEFIKYVYDYSYQIEPFVNFDICLNNHFNEPEYTAGDKAYHRGYADKMYHVLGIGKYNKKGEEISLERVFNSYDHLPYDDSDRDYPTTHIFMPLFFDDRCFGYAIINYGSEVRVYDSVFRIWIRNIMHGLEAFFRQQYMSQLMDSLQANQVRDGLTGLYNYEGFLKECRLIEKPDESTGLVRNVLALDIKGIKALNELRGREYGDRCIKNVARFIMEILNDDEVAGRICNDEFIIGLCDDINNTRCRAIISILREKLKEYSSNTNEKDLLQINYSYVSETKLANSDLEVMVNYVNSAKNHKKKSKNHGEQENGNFEDVIKQTQMVNNLLNQNRFTYHYQPIVSATNGEIFAYEALMRDMDGNVNPFQIIKSAQYLERLRDVERATFLNVTQDVENNFGAFEGKKVFINSIPGTGLTEDDEYTISERFKKNNGMYVVEFTEENEVDDKELAELKDIIKSWGSDIAIDDFGVGFSNVNNLMRYDPKIVKIDRSLISKIQDNPHKQHFVTSIVTYAHDKDIMVLAEGVEDSDELRESIKLGVDLIQGFYTAKPNREVLQEIDTNIKDEIIRFQIQRSEWQTKKV